MVEEAAEVTETDEMKDEGGTEEKEMSEKNKEREERENREKSEMWTQKWRWAIRQVIKANKKKGSMVGVLKSRALKGTSVMERMKRLEDRIYDELVRLQVSA